MNCRDIEALASDYYDGVLSSAAAEEVDVHTQQCDACSDFLHSFQATIQAVRQALIRQAPEGVVDAVNQTVRETISRGA